MSVLLNMEPRDPTAVLIFTDYSGFHTVIVEIWFDRFSTIQNENVNGDSSRPNISI